MNKSKVALAFAVGAALGAAVAYFLQTEKGEDVLDSAKDAAGKLKNDLAENIEKGKQIVKDLSDSAQTILNSIKD